MDRELKRREKQRAKEAKQAEKAAAAPPKAGKAASSSVNEADLNPNVCHQIYLTTTQT